MPKNEEPDEWYLVDDELCSIKSGTISGLEISKIPKAKQPAAKFELKHKGNP